MNNIKQRQVKTEKKDKKKKKQKRKEKHCMFLCARE